MNDHAQDIDWLIAIKNNDRAAFNKLFEKYYKNLCIVARGFVKSKEDAEEVVQDVFFTIWKMRTSLTIAQVQAYLYVSVKNAALAVLRKRKIQSQLFIDSPATVNSSEQEYIFQELNTHIDKAVEKLPQRCRQIFIMSKLEGMRHKEIAALLHISDKTVAHQLAKGTSIIQQSVRHYQANPHTALNGFVTEA